MTRRILTNTVTVDVPAHRIGVVIDKETKFEINAQNITDPNKIWVWCEDKKYRHGIQVSYADFMEAMNTLILKAFKKEKGKK